MPSACLHLGKNKIGISYSSSVVQPLPGYKNAIQVGEREFFSPEEVSEFIDLFYDIWLENIGDPEGVLRLALDRLVIAWQVEKWMINGSAFSEDGIPVKGQFLVLGLTYGPTLIAVSADENLSETSLAHELVHLALWNLHPESKGDPDHLGSKYDFWSYKHSALKDLCNSIAALKIKK